MYLKHFWHLQQEIGCKKIQTYTQNHKTHNTVVVFMHSQHMSLWYYGVLDNQMNPDTSEQLAVPVSAYDCIEFRRLLL